MTPTRELTAELDHDDVIVLPTMNIKLARYIGGSSETPESDGRFVSFFDSAAEGTIVIYNSDGTQINESLFTLRNGQLGKADD